LLEGVATEETPMGTDRDGVRLHDVSGELPERGQVALQCVTGSAGTCQVERRIHDEASRNDGDLPKRACFHKQFWLVRTYHEQIRPRLTFWPVLWRQPLR